MVITSEIVGDVFDSPENSVLIHSCNTLGSWGAGVAASFKARYPQAYNKYRNHCLLPSHENELAGTCLLIEPSDTGHARYWVACLFTSRGFGRNADNEVEIVKTLRGR